MSKLKKLDKLKKLMSDLKKAGVKGYKRYEVTIISIIEESFGEGHGFTDKARKIKSGWGVKSAIDNIHGLAHDTTYDIDKYGEYIELLKESIDFVKYYEDKDADRGEEQMNNKKVFIVHGHDSELKFEVSDWLHRIGLEPIILHLQPNIGITSIIENIERNADVGCAIILMSADDLGKGKDEANLNPRARQNVVFEAGYFTGKLGRSRVIMLFDEGLEAPGDLSGCVYIAVDQYGGWKENVRTEFSGIGIEYIR